jgi:hypothetical protein
VPAAVAVLTLAQLYRVRGVGVWRTVWAEDGTEFYRSAVTEGIGALVDPVAGYLQTVPRLLAIPSTWLPMADVAPYNAVVAAVCVALLAVAVGRFSSFAITSPVLRWTLVALVCLEPIGVGELLNSTTNLIWPLTFACFWAVLSVGESRTVRVAAPAIVFLAVMSQVLCALFVPLAVWVVWTRRDRHSWWVAGAFGAGLLLQTVAVLTATGAGQGDSELLELPKQYAVRVVGDALLGPRWLQPIWNKVGSELAWLLGLGFVVAVALLAWKASSRARTIGLLCVVHSVLFFCVAIYWRGTAVAPLYENDYRLQYARFVALGVLLLVSGVLVLASDLSVGVTLRRLVVVAIVAQSAVLVLVPPRYSTSRSKGPIWEREVAKAQRACEGKRDDNHFGIRVSPDEGWYVRLSCGQIRAEA